MHMRRLGRLFFVFLLTGIGINAHAVPMADASKIASSLHVTPQTVRVKLSDLGRVLDIRGTDLALSLAKKPQLGNVRASEWIVDCKRSLIFQPATGKSRQIPRSGVLIESTTGVLSINERHFREQMVIYPKELLSPYDDKVRSNPQCVVVNHINLEKYLESVVNGEFNSQWAETAVEAQVIAARTYALFQMKEMRRDAGKVFDVESNEKDQVYLGLDAADSRGSQLVAKTRGVIMVAKGSKNFDPIKAFYHASCGGSTVLPEQVWGSHFAGFTHSAVCPYCKNAPSFSWNYQVSFHEVENKIERALEKDLPGRKAWPSSYTRDPSRWILMGVNVSYAIDAPGSIQPSSGFIASAHADTMNARAQDLVFDFLDREYLKAHLKVKMNANQARNWLDPTKLKSTLFSIHSVGRSLVFMGRGSGHGVGMCQWGAKHMGEKGFTAEQILTHYYPGVKLARLW